VDLGSSYLPSEIQAAYLWGQLERIDDIIGQRLANWRHYHTLLLPLHESGLLRLPDVPDECEHNGHMLHIRVQDNPTRSALIRHLRQAGVHAVFHYVPLHTSEAARRYARFHGIDRFTTTESDRIIRLPMFFGLKPEEIDQVVKTILSFFHAES
jgi:dTDP-4-amino-4,6-dideoxygalactose transaminase